jgi:hypothetical protein
MFLDDFGGDFVFDVIVVKILAYTTLLFFTGNFSSASGQCFHQRVVRKALVTKYDRKRQERFGTVTHVLKIW